MYTTPYWNSSVVCQCLVSRLKQDASIDQIDKLQKRFPQEIFGLNKKDGYRQRNVRQFLHILASSGTPMGQSR